MPPTGRGRPGEPDLDGSEEEVARLRAELTRAVARVCPPALAACAEDLVHTTLLRLLAARTRREGEGDLPSFYLRKAAYCAVIDELRRRRRRRETPLPEEEDREAGPAAPRVAETRDPERLVAGRQVARAIRECLRGLVRPRRLAVTLHLQGHSVPEVSGLMGWSAKKADNLVYRGLSDLRACLAAKGVEP